MEASSITPGLNVRAKAADGQEDGPIIGTVAHVASERFVKVALRASDDKRIPIWIPAEWIERVAGDSLFLNRGLDALADHAFVHDPVPCVGSRAPAPTVGSMGDDATIPPLPVKPLDHEGPAPLARFFLKLMQRRDTDESQPLTP